MKTVEVDAAVRYNIVIDKGILSQSGDMIKEVTSAERVAVITDDTVDKLYSDVVMKSLSDAGFETFKFVFPHGEKSKNISTFSSILEFLAESGLTRTDALVALRRRSCRRRRRICRRKLSARHRFYTDTDYAFGVR